MWQSIRWQIGRSQVRFLPMSPRGPPGPGIPYSGFVADIPVGIVMGTAKSRELALVVREAGDPPLQFRGAQAKVPISGIRLTQHTNWSKDWKR
jgi:hypothetical protein